MKKALKITGKIIKWYAISDVLCLAFIGGGQLLKEKRKHPEQGNRDCAINAWDKAINQWKKYFKC